MKKYLVILLCILFVACSVQKRKYQPGFYFGWNHHKNILTNKTKDLSLKNKLREKLVFDVVTDVPNREALNPTVQAIYPTFQANPNDSCDVLIFRDGSEIQGKVIEINTTQIKYKRCDLLNGPLYTVKKSEVFMIKYVGGLREVIKEESPTYTPPSNDRPNYNQTPNTVVQQKTNQVTHPKAIKAFIYGLLSFLSFLGSGTGSALAPLLILFSLVAAIVGLIASVKATKDMKRVPNEFKGRGLAITGRVLSIIILSIFFLVILAVLLVA